MRCEAAAGQEGEARAERDLGTFASRPARPKARWPNCRSAPRLSCCAIPSRRGQYGSRTVEPSSWPRGLAGARPRQLTRTATPRPLSPTNKNATVDVDSPPPRITKASVSEISGLSADASAAAAERVEARRAAEKARIKAERQGPSIRPHPNYQALRGLTSPGAKPLRADWDATSLRRDHAMSSPPPADAPRASGGGGWRHADAVEFRPRPNVVAAADAAAVAAAGVAAIGARGGGRSAGGASAPRPPRPPARRAAPPAHRALARPVPLAVAGGGARALGARRRRLALRAPRRARGAARRLPRARRRGGGAGGGARGAGRHSALARRRARPQVARRLVCAVAARRARGGRGRDGGGARGGPFRPGGATSAALLPAQPARRRVGQRSEDDPATDRARARSRGGDGGEGGARGARDWRRAEARARDATRGGAEARLRSQRPSPKPSPRPAAAAAGVASAAAPQPSAATRARGRRAAPASCRASSRTSSPTR